MMPGQASRLTDAGSGQRSVSLARLMIASALTSQGEIERETALRLRAREIRRAWGTQIQLAGVFFGLAQVEWVRGDLTLAAAYAQQTLRIPRAASLPTRFAVSLCMLGWISEASGDPQRAGVLAGAVHQVRRNFGIPWPSSPRVAAQQDECELRCREALGEARYSAAVEHGECLTQDGIIAYALGEPSPFPAGFREPDRATRSLSPREQQVAELVADGRTNRQIATRLGISQRTAEAHIEHILRKRGFTTRTQIAVWISRGQSLAAPMRSTSRPDVD
jgi:non-specific serine/threonine protein kinase